MSTDNQNKLEAKFANEDKYELVLSACNLGGWEYNCSTGVLLCSPVYFSMIGLADPLRTEWEEYSLEDAWNKFLHPEDLIRAQQCFKNFLEHREGFYMQEFRMKHADGHYIWIESKGKILRDKNTNEPTNILIGSHTDITDKKHLELALAYSRQYAIKDNSLLHSIINSPLDIFIVAIDTNYKYQTFSNLYKQYVLEHFHKEISLGSLILDIFPEHMRDQFKAAIDKALHGERFELNIAIKIDPQSDRLYYFNNRYNPIFDDQHHVTGVTIIVQDITEAKKKELNDSIHQLRYTALFSGANDAIMIANAETGFLVDANEKACELLGYNMNELIGLHQTLLHPPEDLEYIRKTFQEFAITNDYHSIECNLLHRSGRIIPVMITGSSPFKIGNEVFTAGHFKDLTKIKDAEAIILSKIDLLKSSELISNTGSIEINLLTGERLWSDQFYRILGYEPQEMPAQRIIFIDHIHSEDRQAFIKWQDHAVATEGNAGSFQIRIIRKDQQERNLLLQGMTYADAYGKLYKHIGVAKDITDRYEMMMHLEKQNHQLRQIAWSQSHLVRAPLSRLMGLVKAIQDGVVDQKEMPVFLDFIQQSAKELDTVIRDITHKTVQ